MMLDVSGIWAVDLCCRGSCQSEAASCLLVHFVYFQSLLQGGRTLPAQAWHFLAH